ncbi:MAG TPA: HAMP domain-containing histidine kinase, partial [Deltaproteobacteria bacterium]|nr:HAMP domain-containing histidine kinase [Deltaproteobacteria bacterium]
TGVGIPEEYLSNIFDPFFTTKEVGAGTGLGLSIVYGIIQKHKGSISVRSKPGEGTRFTIRLPIKSNS